MLRELQKISVCAKVFDWWCIKDCTKNIMSAEFCNELKLWLMGNRVDIIYCKLLTKISLMAFPEILFKCWISLKFPFRCSLKVTHCVKLQLFPQVWGKSECVKVNLNLNHTLHMLNRTEIWGIWRSRQHPELFVMYLNPLLYYFYSVTGCIILLKQVTRGETGLQQCFGRWYAPS